jgi:hypothetical protein
MEGADDGQTVWNGGNNESLSRGEEEDDADARQPVVRRPRGDSIFQPGAAEKKVNPLQDLLRTERMYVDDLSGIIKVRSPLPSFHPLLLLPLSASG